ncbi:MAG: pyruvate:ferredoxin (flavodoxin) oxidoreductase [Armatimonadetes bacterium]|nr:pyruvate:ferredoxin (flavodoxin) oxidoreductase [Armatimonadota bacterium]
MSRKMEGYDGNSAAAHVAHATNEVIAIYPITPSSPMGEISDEKSARGEKNIWGTIPTVTEMQSEGGASGAVHGALATGALSTTFTASQGLLLMIPNMYKIAGELTPTVFHVTARSLACQALSIFGDHSDVMACRQTGFAMFCSGSVQEAMDFALIAQQATLASRVPFLHYFDGFRTSHEVQKIEELTFDDMRAMIDDDLVIAHRMRALSPDRPTMGGTAQNPDVYFQGRETVNKFYTAAPAIVQETMDKFAKTVGRQYRLFDYVGAPDAEKIIIVMGSGAETVHETVEYLNKKGEKVGLIKVRLYRPFSVKDFIEAIPASVKKIAVLDRTKEPGSLGEPLYMDVVTSIEEAIADGSAPFKSTPLVVGGRFGLGSKEFTPAMVKGVLDDLDAAKPKNHFSVGIEDDVTKNSIAYDASFSTADPSVYRAMFYGLGSDGTVGANKNSIKIIGDETDNYAQGYFVYDSKKAGSVTVSHLRFGKNPIRSPYLIDSANFIACHNPSFIEKYDMLKDIEQGGTFLLTTQHGPDEVWDTLPQEVQKQIIDKNVKFYVIDAISIGQKIGLGARINMIMQAAFFKLTGILPEEQAVDAIKKAIKKTYGKYGDKVVDMNNQAVDAGMTQFAEVKYPAQITSKTKMPPSVREDAPRFVKEVTAEIIAGRGDGIPVSKMPVDGRYPTGTTAFEKRNIAVEIPEWDPELCIQCGFCSLYCPHASIRMKAYEEAALGKAPSTFKSVDGKAQLKGLKFTVQVAPEDCTGCGLCVANCPAKSKENPEHRAINMVPQEPLREAERENWEYFLSIPDTDPNLVKKDTIKGSQLLPALFEFSGACAGCGETPYVKLVSQLFGDRAVIANATGCSSIYGGNLPTTPYTVRQDGRGPAWANSLFEDNAEFGMGFRLTIDKFNEYARELLDQAVAEKMVGADLAEAIKTADQSTQQDIEDQRARVEALKAGLCKDDCSICKQLASVADYLVEKSVWILGGDGWAYDIGYGGLDHVIASGKNVNLLVLDTEVYSNTGGQMSKSTPRGAVAKFAAGGKPLGKKDLAMMAVTYGNVYVARVSLADPNHLVKTLVEAEAYDGPSLIIAYAHCIAHGIDNTLGIEEQKKAIACGHWPLFRYNPDRAMRGENPLTLDSKEPTISFEEYAYGENRYRVLKKINPDAAKHLMCMAEQDVKKRWKLYQELAKMSYDGSCEEPSNGKKPDVKPEAKVEA